MSDEFNPGAEIEIAHPFSREEYHGFDEDGPFKRMSWRPGTRIEPIYPDDAEEVADGIGTQIFTIISIHKPGRFPARVFFTRRWRDPQGNEFGKSKCHIKTVSALRTRCRGYSVPFRLIEPHHNAVVGTQSK